MRTGRHGKAGLGPALSPGSLPDREIQMETAGTPPGSPLLVGPGGKPGTPL
jgi:hypothetical protein